MPTDSKSPVPPLDIEGCVRLLTKCAEDYGFSAFACDTPLLKRIRDERTQIEADLTKLAAFLSDELPGLRQAKLDGLKWSIDQRSADLLAGACCRMVDRGDIDARSEIGDAMLDYASSRHGDTDPIGGVRREYELLRARRADGRTTRAARSLPDSEGLTNDSH